MKKSQLALSLAIGISFATFALADTAEASQNMHRMYNPNSGEHFYTANVGEKDNLVRHGWKYEGVGWVAPDTGADVYRLYNKNAGDHHYTTNLAEKNNLVKLGWKYEGVGWKSDTYKGVKLHRAYNPNAKAGSHNYTTNYAEQKNLIRVGWRDEGTAWYGMNPNQKFNIKVVHKGSDGKILNQQTVSVKRDNNYKASSKTFSGYTLKDSSTQTVKADGNKTITFNYTKNSVKPTPVQKFKITIQYKCEGKFFRADDVVEVEKGKKYTATAPKSDYFTVIGSNKQTITVNGNTTIVFNYSRNPEPITKYNVVVQHKGSDGATLQTETPVQVEKGKQFTANAKSFNGYTLSGNSKQTITVNANATITFNYNKNVVEDLQAIETQVNNQALVNINNHRQANGKSKLAFNSALQKAASVRAKELPIRWDHIRPDGREPGTAAEDAGYDKLSWNENIYAGGGTLEWIKTYGAKRIVDAWIASSGHNATLLDGYNIEGAVGVYIRSNGGGHYSLYASFIPGEPLFSSRSARNVEPKEESATQEPQENKEVEQATTESSTTILSEEE